MSEGPRAAPWAGLAAGAGALATAAALLHRTLTVTLEIGRYTQDIADAGDAIAGNTDVGGELGRLAGAAARIRAAIAAADGGAA